ncbi:hypothetical protein Esti_005653 [Eimeria stiedai]
MEEKQRRLLNPALVKLDQFCRALLYEECVQDKSEQGILQDDTWNHTIFPTAFQVLQKSLQVHTFAGETASDKERVAVLLKRFNNCNETGGCGGCSKFEFFCNLSSIVLGIPCGPERKHAIPERDDGETRRGGSTLAEAALKLPNSEEVEYIAKQIGRLPYGLLSVACARKTRTQEGPVESASGEEQQEERNDFLGQQVPQVLTVSPFWVADKSRRELSFASCLSSSVRQRVVQSVVKLTSLDTKQSKAQDEAINSLTPFPTTFWLCDPKLTAKLSQAELTGWIKEVENGLLEQDTDIQEKIICDNIRFIALRWLLIPKIFLSHFYSANRRCERCKTCRPEGYLFPEYGSDERSTCASCEAQEAAEAQEGRTTGETSMRKITNKCVDCSECCCKLCKLLQCHRLRGIGGLLNFCRVRCLHMQYAHHLACPTTLGLKKASLEVVSQSVARRHSEWRLSVACWA